MDTQPELSDEEKQAQSLYWDTEYLTRRFFAGMPARVDRCENKGRFVVAARDIQMGSKVVEIDQPYAFSVSDEFTHRACAWCMRLSPSNNQDFVFCENCNESFYCSDSCKIIHRQRHHQYECSPLRVLGRQKAKMTYEDMFTARMIINLLSRRRLELDGPELVEDKLEMQFTDALLLTANRDQVANRVLTKREKLWDFLTKALPLRTSLTYEIDENTFGIRGNINLSYAYGFYPSISFINHACGPNLGVVQDKKKLVMYALRDIKEGAELNISYLEMNRSTAVRRRYLMAEYNFYCLCERCCAGLDGESDTFAKKYLCPNVKCDGKGILIPVAREGGGSKFDFYCNLCQKVNIVGHVEDLSEEKPHGLCEPLTGGSNPFGILGDDAAAVDFDDEDDDGDDDETNLNDVNM